MNGRKVGERTMKKEIIAYFVKPKGAPAIDEQLVECLLSERDEQQAAFRKLGYDYRVAGSSCVSENYQLKRFNQ